MIPEEHSAFDEIEDNETDRDVHSFPLINVGYWELLVPKRAWAFLTSKEKKEAAWLGYYAGLYQIRGPDVKKFQRLLHRYGVWDFKTPFREGGDFSYYFHPDNIFLADINFVLDAWQNKVFAPPPQTSQSSLTIMEDIEKNWHDLYTHRPSENLYRSVALIEKDGVERYVRQEKQWEEQGLACLAVLFSSPVENWMWLGKWLHRDNKKILSHLVAKSKVHKKKKILSQLVKANWLSKADIKWLENNVENITEKSYNKPEEL